MTEPSAASGACPICKKPVQLDYRPFCSKRCADIDLSRWLKGVYAIPGTAQDETEAAPEDESESAPASDRRRP